MQRETIKIQIDSVRVQDGQDMTSNTNFHGRRVFLEATDSQGTVWSWGTTAGTMPPVGGYVQASTDKGRRSATLDFVF